MLATFASVLCGVGATRTAHAAGWQITYTRQGQSVSQGDGPYTSTWSPGPSSFPNDPGTVGGNASASVRQSSSGTYPAYGASSQGTLTVIFDWVKSSYETAPVPANLAFKVSAYTYASGYAWSPVTLTATTGFSSEVRTPAKGTGVTASTSTPPRYSGLLTTRVAQIIMIPTNGQTHIVWKLPPLTAVSSVQAMTTKAPSGSLIADAETGERVDLSNYGLYISRSGAPTAKSENDSSLDKNRDEWIEADGTRHGNTTYSYN